MIQPITTIAPMTIKIVRTMDVHLFICVFILSLTVKIPQRVQMKHKGYIK